MDRKTSEKDDSAPRNAAALASAAKGAPVEPTLVFDSKPVVTAPGLKKKELIDLVVERSGVKKKFAKPSLEAMLTILGEALGEGRELNLQPLGKVKVTNIKSVANGKVMNTRIRQSEQSIEELAEAAAEDAVGEAEEKNEISVKETLADGGQ